MKGEGALQRRADLRDGQRGSGRPGPFQRQPSSVLPVQLHKRGA